ncbi:MAG: BlaI/MecI/CopY family transcriptional regulator [Sphingobacteriia bacterium]|nr:BlaI/MecI/CopY family transcriptional regulator [Sphingobacteriia bacterium]
MEIKQLTKAEEQIMQSLWKLQRAYLKDVVEDQPEPRPHSNTVATVLKILMEKGFVDVEVHGRVYSYFPVVSKEDYSSNTMNNLVDSYFEGSFADAVSFMVNQKKLKLKDLELLLQHLKTKK